MVWFALIQDTKQKQEHNRQTHISRATARTANIVVWKIYTTVSTKSKNSCRQLWLTTLKLKKERVFECFKERYLQTLLLFCSHMCVLPGRCCSWNELGCWTAANGGKDSSAGWRWSPFVMAWLPAPRSEEFAPQTSDSTPHTSPPHCCVGK